MSTDDTLREIELLVEKPRVLAYRNKGTFYPSDASARIDGILYGGCHRAAWYRDRTDRGLETKTDPANAKALMKMAFGDLTHSWFLEQLKRARLYHADEVEFIDPASRISGRVDAFSIHPHDKHIIGWEVKSIGDHQFPWIQKGGPKMEHVLQVLVYMSVFKSVKDWRILYISRGGADMFPVQLYLDVGGCPVVMGNKIQVTFQDIVDRFKELREKLKADALPEREYQVRWDKERLKLAAEKGDLNATDLTKFKKGHSVSKGDWQCSYCPWKKACWPEQGP